MIKNQKNTSFVLKSKDLEKKLGNRMEIKRQLEQGKFQGLGSGLYASNDLDPFTALMLAVAKYYPRAVISNRTAMFVHGLSDHAVEFLDIDIPNSGSIQNQILSVHRVSPKKLIGKSKLRFKGVDINIYDMERTLCEAYRLDPAGPEFFKALKRYLKSKEPDTEKIGKYDSKLGTKVIVHIMQELADE